MYSCLLWTLFTTTQPMLTTDAMKTCIATEKHLIETASKYKMDPFVIASLIWHESRYKKDATSKKNACGLTQVRGFYVKKTCKELYNPKVSIEIGTKILYSHKKRGKNLTKALECYNSGNKCYAPLYAKKILKLSNQLKRLSKKSSNKSSTK